MWQRTAVQVTADPTGEPDVLFVRQDRRPAIAEREVRGAPDLVGEMVPASTAARDRGVKRGHYARAGVRSLG